MSVSDPVVSRPATAPMCGRCYKPVEIALSIPIVQNDELVGQKLTYSCHGETQDFEVTKEWFEEPEHVNKPFVNEVFRPAVVEAPTKEQSLRDDIISQHRKRRIANAEYVQQVIKDLVVAQLDFEGDVHQWCKAHKLQLVSDVGEIMNAELEIKKLSINGKIVGQFEIPMFIDDNSIAYVPAVPKSGK